MIVARLICAFVVVLSFSACEKESYEEKEATQQHAAEAIEAQNRERSNELIKAFSAKYNVDGTWLDLIKDKTISTLQLQQSLIRSDGRPILALANILDVEKRNGTFRLLFYVPRVGRLSLQQQYLILDLQCALPESEAMALKIEEFTPYANPQYLLATRIGSVRRAHQFASPKSGSPITAPTIEFVGEGQCVAVEAIEPVERATTPATEEHRKPKMRH